MISVNCENNTSSCLISCYNELLDNKNILKRVALIAISVLSVHPSIGLPFTLISDSIRLVNADHKNLFETSVAVIALAGSIFNHSIGPTVIILQDLITEMIQMHKSKNRKEISMGLFKIFNNLIALGSIYRGSLSLSIVANLMQSVAETLHSREEFEQDHWIEGIGSLILAGTYACLFLNQARQNSKHLREIHEIDK